MNSNTSSVSPTSDTLLSPIVGANDGIGSNNNNNNNNKPFDTTTRFSFQHFDQESDFGFENENGEHIRKRKRPGRKPNPPTVQERRAQNRAAQRAFREREQRRKEEKDRENQAHLEELVRLRKKLAQVQYEANYLRGCVLLLCLTSLVERGSVPHIWTDTRLFPIPWTGKPPTQPEDSVNSIPAILKTVLGENNQILDFQSSLMTARCTGWELPDQIEQLLNGGEKFIPPSSASSQGEEEDEEEEREEGDEDVVNENDTKTTKNKRRRKSYNSTMSNSSTNEETSQTISTILQQRQLSSSSPSPPLPPPPSSQHEHQLPLSPASQHGISSSNRDNKYNNNNNNNINDKDEERISPYIGTESMVQHFTATKNVYGTIREPPTLKTPDDLTHLPSLQALHILKIQLKAASILGDITRITIIPTALQQLIPHDVRIDYIPSPSLRDRMILFQDYYDANEVFELLSTKTKFIGGDTRDSRNWVPDPKFSERYWFLSHQLVDYHSGEGALIPEFIDAIIASQREKEIKMKRLKKEKEERLRKEEPNAKKPSNNNHHHHTTTASNNSTSTTSATTNSTLSSISIDSNNTARRPPISSVRKERSSNIRSLPLDS